MMRNKSIVPLICYPDPLISIFKLKQGYQITRYKLCSNWAAPDILWEPLSTEGIILLNLYYSQLIIPAFCLYRKDIVCSFFIDAYINFICLNLSNSLHRCS